MRHAALDRLAHDVLGPAAGELRFHRPAGVAQGDTDADAFAPVDRAGGNDDGVGSGGGGGRGLAGEQQTVDADGAADRRDRLMRTQRLQQVVVAPAAAQMADAGIAARVNLEHEAGVIFEAAMHADIEGHRIGAAPDRP